MVATIELIHFDAKGDADTRDPSERRYLFKGIPVSTTLGVGFKARIALGLVNTAEPSAMRFLNSTREVSQAVLLRGLGF